MIAGIIVAFIMGFSGGQVFTTKTAVENKYICRVEGRTKRCYDLSEDLAARDDRMGSQVMRSLEK